MMRLSNPHNSSAFMLLVGFALSVAALVVMLSIGEAGKNRAVGGLNLPPPNADVFLVKYRRGDTETKTRSISRREVLQIRALPSVSHASAFAGHSDWVKYSRYHGNFRIMGVDEDYFPMIFEREHKPEAVAGRLLEGADIDSGAAVCAIPSRVRERLHVEQVGETIRIDGRPYRVVGFSENASSIHIPITDYTAAYGKDCYMQVLLTDISAASQENLKENLKKILGTRDEIVLFSICREFYNKSYEAAYHDLVSQGLVGAVPLLITFFGAMGMSVAWLQERRYHFALLRALGATRGQVALQARPSRW